MTNEYDDEFQKFIDMNEEEKKKEFFRIADLLTQYINIKDSNERFKFAMSLSQFDRESIMEIARCVAMEKGWEKEFHEMEERAKIYVNEMNKTEH